MIGLLTFWTIMNFDHIWDKCYLYCKNGGKCMKSVKGDPEKCKCSGIYIGKNCEHLRGKFFVLAMHHNSFTMLFQYLSEHK